MANEQVIDQVIAPIVDSQVASLDKLLKDLDIQISKNIQSANQLNAVTGNSKTFKAYQTDATAAALAIEKVTLAQNKTAEAAAKIDAIKAKTAATESARQAKAIADQQKLDDAKNKSEATSARQASAEAARQARASANAAKAQGEYAKLLASYNLATLAARNAGVAHGVASEQFEVAATRVRILRTQLDSIDQPLGNFQRNVGNYTNSFIQGFGKVYSVIRQAAFILPGLGISGIFLLLFDGIKKASEALGLFNTKLNEAEQRQKALKDAFSSTDYAKAVEGTEKLAVNLDLAKNGFADSNAVIDEYNNSIGKTFGFVDSLNDAQKGFIENSQKYIRAMYLEAAANIVLADSSKYAAEIAVKNQKLRDDIFDAFQQKAKIRQAFKDDPNALGGDERGVINAQNRRIKSDLEDIKTNNVKAHEQYDRAISSLKDFYTEKNKIVGGKGSVGDATGGTEIERLRNDIANQELEREKLIAQNLINNDKLTYSKRIKAVEDFYTASKGIADNNEKLATANTKLSADQKLKIEQAYGNEVLQLQQSRDASLLQLRDAAYKQDQEILKNNIQKQKDLQKAVVDDPDQSYPAKLGAIQLYNDRSIELINANYKEQLKAAGENGKSIKLAEQNKAKSILQLDTETAATRLKIAKENLQKILEASQQSEQAQLETLDNASKVANRALGQVKDEKINALSLERAQGKITEKKYNDELLAINDAYNIQLIQQEIETQRTILAIKEGNRDATLTRMRVDGATPEDLAKFTSGANKGIQPTKNKIADLGVSLGNAVSKQTIDQTKSGASDADKKRNSEIFALQETGKVIDVVDKLRQKAYEAEIARLEKVAELVDENAANEKQHVNDSILSNATKARQIAVIDANTARQKKAIQLEENKVKHKNAIIDKEIAIAKIILETAIAAIKAPAELGPILGLAAVPIVLALGAIELAAAIAAPIPAFAKGGTTKGGAVYWGEAGMESARLPDGSVRFSTGPEIANFPKGTIITPHMELMQQIKPASVQYTGAEQIPWRELIKAVKDNKTDRRQKLVINVDGSYEQYKRSYLNR